MNIKEEAKEILVRNFELTGGKYIFPASFYLAAQFRWDSAFQAIACALLGLKDLAKNETIQLFKGQHPDGFIPSMQYEERRPLLVNLFNIERWLFTSWRVSNDYTQAPLEAQALEAINDQKFTQDFFDKVLRGYLYFLDKRDPDGNDLISIIHPHEIRDADPTFDPVKLKFLRVIPNKLIGNYLINSVICGTYLCGRYRCVNWNLEKIFKLNLFNVKDVMFNCIWVDGMVSLERLAADKKAQNKIKCFRERVERAIINSMWDKKEKSFWALDGQGRPIRIESISNLTPLLLPNISLETAQALLEKLTNTKKFWLPYPVPTVPADNPAFNPNYPKDPTIKKALQKIWTVPGLWRGPTCMATNWLIVKGLLLQAKRFRNKSFFVAAQEIAQKSYQMIRIANGFYEFYNPYTGEGERANDYGWATLAATFRETLDND